MEIKAFAEGLLTATTLAGKLFVAPNLEDQQPLFTGTLPDMPSRPPELAFVSKPSNELSLSKLKNLRNDRERGQILHFFANHELMAIELMALALLKFPHAPKLFRQHLLRTIADEQKHCRFYLERLQECGVALGDVPLGASFWNQAKGMSTPEEYICAMCLTLEQANLDFALEYERRFREAGDESSAQLLHSVYQDELFHVRLGVDWMERWKKPEESQWDFHVRHLHFPLNPARAKSFRPNAQARLDCGLTPDYIETLSQFQHSKGRPPDVFWFNGLGESDLFSHGSLTKTRLELEIDLESSMSIFACDDDLQIVRRAWSKEFKQHLKDSGRNVPEILDFGTEFSHPHIGAFKPWMWTSALKKDFAHLAELQTRPEHIDAFSSKRLAGFKPLFSKVEQRPLEAQVPQHALFRAPLQQIIASEAQLLEALQRPDFAESWVMKCPMDSAGHGVRFGQGTDSIPWNWINTTLKQQGQLVLEVQCQRRAEYSILGEFQQGKLHWTGHTRMLVDARGTYHGALLGDDWRGFNEQEHRRLFCDGQPFYRSLQEQLSNILAPWLTLHHYQGLFGVDCFVYQKNEQLFVRPLSEVNVRCSFGHMALQLKKRIKHGRVAIMFFCPKKYWHNLRQLRMDSQRGLWVNGLIACNDLWTAQQTGLFCWVGQNSSEFFSSENTLIFGEFLTSMRHLIDAN